MAYIDTTIPYASGSVSGVLGSPSGGGSISVAGGSVGQTAPGNHGVGGSGQIHHWILAFYGIIAFILISTGVLFNGKGRRV